MTKKEKDAFIERLLFALEDGIKVRSWRQVRVTAAVLAKALA